MRTRAISGSCEVFTRERVPLGTQSVNARGQLLRFDLRQRAQMVLQSWQPGGSRHRDQRAASSRTAARVRVGILPPLPHPPVSRQGRARAACDGTAGKGQGGGAAGRWRSAPPVCAASSLSGLACSATRGHDWYPGARWPSIRVGRGPCRAGWIPSGPSLPPPERSTEAGDGRG